MCKLLRLKACSKMYLSHRLILKYQLVFNFLKGDTGNLVSSFGEESEKEKYHSLIELKILLQ